ncbi:MAG: S46 family peptidase, partial [Phycisphaerales bacterium]|nr:S46 family peptidase [Phycisphaerales bacterium]
ASDADAAAARRKAMSTIEEAARTETGLDCQMVTLFHGGQYHLYCYKTYTDIRLVFAPEAQIAFFGGDTDNFEYPRYCLDMCFFRIYEDNAPLKPENHLRWSADGADENELIFVFGHPGRTRRLYTVDHLEFLRDTVQPMQLRSLYRREVQLAAFGRRSKEFARISNEDLSGVQNNRKRDEGLLAGMQNPALVAKKTAAEQQLRSAVDANPEYKDKWGNAWSRIAEAEKKYGQMYTDHWLLGANRFLAGSALGALSRDLVRLGDELPKPSADRLREYRDSNLESLYLDLYSPAPIYENLEIEKLSSGLSLMASLLGGDDQRVVKALAGKSPQARAEELVAGTKLKDVAFRKQLAEAAAAGNGGAAIKAANDPLLSYFASLDADSRAARKAYEDQVESVERDAYAKIAAAKFAIQGADQYPDATFTLRLSYGTAKSYQQDGAIIPPFTTFNGLFERHTERFGGGTEDPFALPQRWLDRKEKLDLSTPYNMVTTADIIGGNSGSPVVDKRGEVVGLIFDSNVQALIGDMMYSPEAGRSVAVDSRGIIEALRKVYAADALAKEITGR